MAPQEIILVLLVSLQSTRLTRAKVTLSRSGGLTASVPDFAKIVRSIFMKTILKPETIDLMEQDYTGSATIGDSPAKEAGLGWRFGK